MKHESAVFKEASNIDKITLWGPTGSGKSWLVHAFARELLTYSLNDFEFLYELTDENGRPLDPLEMNRGIRPTAIIQDEVFRFRRIGKKDSTAHRVSSHTHTLSIIDNAGKMLTDLKDIPTAESLIDSPNTILLLDVSQSLLPQSEALGDQQRAPLTGEEYVDMVDRVLKLFSKSVDVRRRIAVCVSKCDLFSIRREPESLIQIAFGSPMAQLLKYYSALPNITLRLFSVSAFGFDQGGRPNFDWSTGNIADIGKWEPYNVASPFFWFFESIELERLWKHKSFLFDPKRYYKTYPIRRF